MEAGRFKLDDFELHRIARELRKKTYRLIRMLPGEEKYALANQMRRAAVSVTNNIAEGHGRWHFQENMRYCRISRGSIDELIDDLNICQDEHYGDPKLVAELGDEAYQLIHRINGYILYLRRSNKATTSND